MKKVLISLVLLITTICAYAADWQAYEEKGFFIDKSSITKNNNSIKAWILIVGHGELIRKNTLIYKATWMQNALKIKWHI